MAIWAATFSIAYRSFWTAHGQVGMSRNRSHVRTPTSQALSNPSLHGHRVDVNGRRVDLGEYCLASFEFALCGKNEGVGLALGRKDRMESGGASGFDYPGRAGSQCEIRFVG